MGAPDGDADPARHASAREGVGALVLLHRVGSDRRCLLNHGGNTGGEPRGLGFGPQRPRRRGWVGRSRLALRGGTTRSGQGSSGRGSCVSGRRHLPGLVAITLTVAAVNDLLSHSVPEHSLFAMTSAGVSALVLAPLGWAKHRTGRLLGSHALMGDGTLSAIGAALGIVALLGLLAEQLLGWWWADRVTAICVALVAAAEAVRVLRLRPD